MWSWKMGFLRPRKNQTDPILGLNLCNRQLKISRHHHNMRFHAGVPLEIKPYTKLLDLSRDNDKTHYFINTIDPVNDHTYQVYWIYSMILEQPSLKWRSGTTPVKILCTWLYKLSKITPGEKDKIREISRGDDLRSCKIPLKSLVEEHYPWQWQHNPWFKGRRIVLYTP